MKGQVVECIALWDTVFYTQYTKLSVFAIFLSDIGAYPGILYIMCTAHLLYICTYNESMVKVQSRWNYHNYEIHRTCNHNL